MIMRDIINKLGAVSTILITYIVLNAVTTVYHLYFWSASELEYWISPLIFLLYCLAAYGAYKRYKVALWVMIVTLVLSGVVGTILGIFIVPLSQPVSKAAFAVFGLYYVFGAYRLYCSLWHSKCDGKENIKGTTMRFTGSA
jgi:hypothetical protein